MNRYPSPSGLKGVLARLHHPLIQAPMAGVQDSALAVAVSRAGGLGSVPAAMLDAAGLAQQLHALQAALGPQGLPYNINFFCHVPPTPCPQAEAKWQAALAPYYQAWGVTVGPAGTPTSRQPFNAEFADVLAAFRPPVVSFHFGLPSPDLLDRVKSWGSVVLSTATTVEEGLWLEAHGADGVIAQGLEAGGHRGHFLRPPEDLSGQLPLAALLKALKHTVDRPIVAAGGLGSPCAVREALAGGAVAVQVGTAFLLCDEAKTPAVHRLALERAARAAASSTAITRLFSGRPARGLRNRLMQELDPMSPLAPAFPLASGALAPLRARAEAAGCDDFTPLWSGESPPTCEAASAAAVVEWLMSQQEMD